MQHHIPQSLLFIIIMFVFGFKITQVWVKIALLILCFSICPHWCHPHAETDEEDEMTMQENLDNEEDDGVVDDEDETEEEEREMDGTGTKKIIPCKIERDPCEKDKECCGDMFCTGYRVAMGKACSDFDVMGNRMDPKTKKW